MVFISVCYLFYQKMDEKNKTWTLRFPPKKTLIWRRHCSIDQSCCSMMSKRFLESSSGMKFIQPSVRLTNQNLGGLYPFNKPIKPLYFRSFVVFVLFMRFHFKVMRKSL